MKAALWNTNPFIILASCELVIKRRESLVEKCSWFRGFPVFCIS